MPARPPCSCAACQGEVDRVTLYARPSPLHTRTTRPRPITRRTSSAACQSEVYWTPPPANSFSWKTEKRNASFVRVGMWALFTDWLEVRRYGIIKHNKTVISFKEQAKWRLTALFAGNQNNSPPLRHVTCGGLRQILIPSWKHARLRLFRKLFFSMK